MLFEFLILSSGQSVLSKCAHRTSLNFRAEHFDVQNAFLGLLISSYLKSCKKTLSFLAYPVYWFDITSILYPTKLCDEGSGRSWHVKLLQQKKTADDDEENDDNDDDDTVYL